MQNLSSLSLKNLALNKTYFVYAEFTAENRLIEYNTSHQFLPKRSPWELINSFNRKPHNSGGQSRLYALPGAHKYSGTTKYYKFCR